jgi:excisionase family DNA binding protein
MSSENKNPFEPLVAMIADAVVERLRRAEAPRLLTISEAARELRRSERWVRMEIAAGRLECVREGRSRPRITREILERWIAERNGRG